MPAIAHCHHTKLELEYYSSDKDDEDDDIISVVSHHEEKRNKSDPVRSKSMPSLTTAIRRRKTSSRPKRQRRRREKDANRTAEKKVRFDRMVKKKPIKKWSAKECQKAWYSEEEMMEILCDCAVVLKASIEKIPSSLEPPTLELIPFSHPKYAEENICARGLEVKVAKEQKRRNKVKRLARESVFREQERQWQSGIRDEESISRAYGSSAKNAAWAARLWGLKDEFDAMTF